MTSLLATALLLAVGCAVDLPVLQAQRLDFGGEPDTSGGASLLEDTDSARVEVSVEVDELEVAAGVDVLLDWSGLSVDMWGRPLEPLVDAQRASLYHFTISDLDEVLDGLIHGTLPQSVLELQVGCASETASCYLSEFAFMMGHEVDVVERFEEGDGIWLLAIESNDGSEDLAYLSLVPVEGHELDLARVTDDSSVQHLDTDLRALPLVTVARDGVMMVDWGELSTDCLGDPMDPRLIDRVVAARVPDEALDDPEPVLLALHEVALELWRAQVPNSASSFPLAELEDVTTGQRGFAGPDGPDAWLLLLACTTCGDAYPRFVTQLAWAEGAAGQATLEP